MKWTRLLKSYKSKAYQVELIKIENGDWSSYKTKNVMSLKEAKELAKSYVLPYKDNEDFYIATVEKGTTYWGESADDFGSGNYILGISNKNDMEIKNALGSSYYDFEQIETI